VCRLCVVRQSTEELIVSEITMTPSTELSFWTGPLCCLFSVLVPAYGDIDLLLFGECRLANDGFEWHRYRRAPIWSSVNSPASRFLGTADPLFQGTHFSRYLHVSLPPGAE
jgi:hypothetical protein